MAAVVTVVVVTVAVVATGGNYDCLTPHIRTRLAGFFVFI